MANLVKISSQPHTTLCIQFLDRENNDKNNTSPLGKQICYTIVWGCAEILSRLRFHMLRKEREKEQWPFMIIAMKNFSIDRSDV